MTAPGFKRHPELVRRRIPLPASERQALQASVEHAGVVVPLVLARLAGELFMLDGHERQDVCDVSGIVPPYHIQEVQDEAELVLLFVQLQLARRMLSGIGQAFLRGRTYLERKQQGSTSRHSGEKLAAAELAERFGTSPRTIERDGSLARALIKIEQDLGQATLHALCTGEVTATRRQLNALSKMSLEEAHAAFEQLRSGIEPDVCTKDHSCAVEGAREHSMSVNNELTESHADGPPSPVSASTSRIPIPATVNAPKTAKVSAPEAATRSRRARASQPSRGLPPWANGSVRAAPIFADAPTLEQALQNVASAQEKLAPILEVWRTTSRRDVAGLAQRLAQAVKSLARARTIIDAELIPRQACEDCPGADCERCEGFGWFSNTDLDATAAETADSPELAS